MGTLYQRGIRGKEQREMQTGRVKPVHQKVNQWSPERKVFCPECGAAVLESHQSKCKKCKVSFDWSKPLIVRV